MGGRRLIVRQRNGEALTGEEQRLVQMYRLKERQRQQMLRRKRRGNSHEPDNMDMHDGQDNDNVIDDGRASVMQIATILQNMPNTKAESTIRLQEEREKHVEENVSSAPTKVAELPYQLKLPQLAQQLENFEAKEDTFTTAPEQIEAKQPVGVKANGNTSPLFIQKPLETGPPPASISTPASTTTSTTISTTTNASTASTSETVPSINQFKPARPRPGYDQWPLQKDNFSQSRQPPGSDSVSVIPESDDPLVPYTVMIPRSTINTFYYVYSAFMAGHSGPTPGSTVAPLPPSLRQSPKSYGLPRPYIKPYE
ncbi:hypothetical protein V1512DRAFT_256176 [Lipomyces arxii]|uniref:uncharacterized protein n=1 Tax=Lipomyces arxii TaxID=56418 RepID=UPI0034CEA648